MMCTWPCVRALTLQDVSTRYVPRLVDTCLYKGLILGFRCLAAQKDRVV